jgi:phosphoglycolate phosphatase-like HAD superfamily hydrolase
MASAAARMNEPSASSALAVLRSAATVFWDFDGVIKDSVEIKTLAFERLFMPYGRAVADRVRAHHEANGGVSRFEKLRIYLKWVGEQATEQRVDEFSGRFSELVCQAVIESPWVPGVGEYLRAHHRDQEFVIVSGTPQDEMEHILAALQIAPWFREVHGAPTPKAAAIREALQRLRRTPDECVVVGDAATDLEAARANGVRFVLRRTAINGALQQSHTGPSFLGLNHE